MEILDKIHESVHRLLSIGSERENIKITTSFITKKIIEEAIYKNSMMDYLQGAKPYQIFGANISFDHYSNDIVIYDVTRACYVEDFMITIQISDGRI